MKKLISSLLMLSVCGALFAGTRSAAKRPIVVTIAQDGTGDVNYSTGTEWTTAWIQALAMLPSTGGQIFIKKGTYVLLGSSTTYPTSREIRRSNVQITGESFGSVTLQAQGFSSNGPQCLFIGSAPFTAENIIFESAVSGNSSSKQLVSLDVSTGTGPILIRNCKFTDSGSRGLNTTNKWVIGLSLFGGNNNIISGCIFENVVSNNFVNVKRSIITNNSFNNAQANFGGQNETIGKDAHGSIISDNKFNCDTNPVLNSTSPGVVLLFADGCDDCQITGNTFEITDTLKALFVIGLRPSGNTPVSTRGLVVANNVFRSTRTYNGANFDRAISIQGGSGGSSNWLIANNVNLGWHNSFEDTGGVINSVYTGNLNEGNLYPETIRSMDYSGTKFAVTHTTNTYPSSTQVPALTMSHPFNSQSASIGMWPNSADNRLELDATAGRYVLRGDGTKGAGGSAVSPALYLISDDTATAGGFAQVRMNYDRANNIWNFNGYSPYPTVSMTNINSLNVSARIYSPSAYTFGELYVSTASGAPAPFLYAYGGRVGIGIGTTTPSGTLHVEATGSNIPLYVNGESLSRISRTTSNTASSVGPLALLHITSSDMVDGFGLHIPFGIRDSAGVTNYIAGIGASRDGADSQGALRFLTNGLTFANERMRISQAGDVGIGTSTPTAKLDVVGTIKATGLSLPAGTIAHSVLSGTGSLTHAEIDDTLSVLVDSMIVVNAELAAVPTTYVNVTGDTMTGDLIVETTIYTPVLRSTHVYTSTITAMSPLYIVSDNLNVSTSTLDFAGDITLTGAVDGYDVSSQFVKVAVDTNTIQDQLTLLNNTADNIVGVIEAKLQKSYTVLHTNTDPDSLNTAIQALNDGDILEVNSLATYNPISIPADRELIIRPVLGKCILITGTECVKLMNGARDTIIAGVSIASCTTPNANYMGAGITFGEHYTKVSNITFYNISIDTVFNGGGVMLSYHWSVDGDDYATPNTLSECSDQVRFINCCFYKACKDNTEGASLSLRGIVGGFIYKCHFRDDTLAMRQIQLQNCMQSYVGDNNIRNTATPGSNGEGIKIDDLGGCSYRSSAYVIGNIIKNAVEGIDVDDLVDAYVLDNVTYECTEEGISVDDSATAVIGRNLSYNNRFDSNSAGIRIENGAVVSLHQNNCVNNSINYRIENSYSLPAGNGSSISDVILRDSAENLMYQGAVVNTYDVGDALNSLQGQLDPLATTYVNVAGDTMSGQLTVTTITVSGSAFSVGGSTLVVREGNVGIGTLSPIDNLSIATTTAMFSINGSTATGVGISGLGMNCPAVDATTVFTWIKCSIANPDGSNPQVIYIPAWK